MKTRVYVVTILVILLSVLSTSVSWGRAAFEVDKDKLTQSTLSAQGPPAFCVVSQNIGKMALAVSNNGTLGDGWAAGGGLDCITGLLVPSCEYPKNSNVRYLFAAAFWIGAIVGRDTLVSTGADGWSSNSNEFSPDEAPWGEMVYRSIRFPEIPRLFNGAVSEQDFIATYSDTFPYVDQAAWQGIQHRPLHIEVTQRSYGWSYSYAEDFILFDYEIRNIGRTPLENVYMGFYNDSDVGFDDPNANLFNDDICGFRETFISTYENTCDFTDTVNLAWIADNDGDPDGGSYTDNSCPHVTAMRVVRTPADQLNVSFNWWISNGDPNADYGPREREGVGVWPEEFRDFGTGGLGTPEGDRNKYYMLRNQEFDFDQIYTAVIGSTNPVWTTPPPEAPDLANGYDTRYLLSFGPFNIEPGERLPISFAYVAGENLHRDPTNVNFLPNEPDIYYAGLDFSDLSLNSTWASRVYDNPGVDSDGDGDSGSVRVCCFDEAQTQCDTIWYKGDGVPDFQGASPPPPPVTRLQPTVGGVRVVFNGLRTETTKDVFSRIVDFEGYRVYIARDERESSFSMLASYDIEDYNKYVFNPDRVPEPGYELFDVPYTVDSLKALYGEYFDPRDYPQTSPFVHPDFSEDSVFYFDPQDHNSSELGISTPIRKVYPDQPYPSSLEPSECDPSELTEDGFIKYFEYELVIDSLLPTVEWFLSVTSFDFGSPEADLQALESAITNSSQAFYPLASWDEVQQRQLQVFVYPNPYRSNAGYRADGYEGRMETDRPDDRVREVHFANLPPTCIIRIYTIDGDLVREIEHDSDLSDPTASHETWNLVSRNTQMVVSGMYYWTVEAEGLETQIGKLVVIM